MCVIVNDASCLIDLRKGDLIAGDGDADAVVLIR